MKKNSRFQELGVELIQRENRRFHLTAAGEYFYRHSRGLLCGGFRPE